MLYLVHCANHDELAYRGERVARLVEGFESPFSASYCLRRYIGLRAGSLDYS